MTVPRSGIDTSKRDLRKTREHLRDLSRCVDQALAAIDGTIQQGPSTAVERGRNIAAACNALDLANQQATHFGLGASLKKCGVQNVG